MKVNKKVLLATGLAVAASMLALAGCSSTGSTPAPTESGAASGSLTVWVDADRARALEDVAKTFEKEKGVKVNLVVKDYGKIRDEFTAQVPTGKGPDITIGGHDWIGAFVKDGIVAPVELGDKSADFEKIAMEAVSYDGKTVTYGSDAELAIAIRDLEGRIAAASGNSSRRRRWGTIATKGL